jgi:outer membrane protein assembly factor BamB
MICRHSILNYLLTMFLLLGTCGAFSQDKNWTCFRGSNLNGIAASDNIPLKWDDSVISWKTAIHDQGYSSPVIYNNQIWVTTATADGKKLYAVCIDYMTGKIIYDIPVFTPESVEGKNSLNTYASPTACIEKGFVYVHFGSNGTACINTSNGLIVWKRTDLKCKHVQGPASSPIIYKNLLVLHFEGTDVRYIVALNKATGETVWKTDRPEEPYQKLASIGRKAYVTPIIITVKGRDMLISNGSAVCEAFDPLTGKEIWRVIGGGESTVAMPFTEKGILYWYTGFEVASNGKKYNELLAVNPDGTGDITGSNIIWKKKDDLSRNHSLTPVIKDGLIYTVSTLNKMMCIDEANGSEVWSTHLNSNYDASPLYVNGNVWFFSVKGEAMVIKAGRKYEVVADNQLDSGIWATPAVLRNSIIVRTQKYIYKISRK